MLWLWGVNVRFFEARRVRYGACFAPHDQAFLLSGRQIHQARPQPLASADIQAPLLRAAVQESVSLFVYLCMGSLTRCMALPDTGSQLGHVAGAYDTPLNSLACT